MAIFNSYAKLPEGTSHSTHRRHALVPNGGSHGGSVAGPALLKNFTKPKQRGFLEDLSTWRKPIAPF